MKLEQLIIIRQRNYWGKGDTLANARKSYAHVAHRQATNLASIVMYVGKPDDLNKIVIDDVFGGIQYPVSLTQYILQ